jgi:hypothetical protein
LPTFTEGSVIFADVTGNLSEDNNRLFWKSNVETAYDAAFNIVGQSNSNAQGALLLQNSEGKSWYFGNGKNLSLFTQNLSPAPIISVFDTGTNPTMALFSLVHANSTGNGNLQIGRRNGATTGFTTGANNIAVGTENIGNPTTGNDNTIIGANAANGITTGHSNVFLGSGKFESGQFNYSIALGAGKPQITAHNQLVIGGNVNVGARIKEVFIGTGVHVGLENQILPLTIQTTGIKAGNTDLSASGGVFNIAGARGTGTGLGGDVVVQVAPAGVSGSNQNNLVNLHHFFRAGYQKTNTVGEPEDDPVDGFYHYSKLVAGVDVPHWRLNNGKIISLSAVETPTDKVQLSKDLNDTEEIPYLGLRDFDATIGNAFDFHVNEIDSIGVPSVKKPGVSQDYVTPDSYADFVAWANGTTDLDTGNSDISSGTLPVPATSENWVLRTGVPVYDSAVISGQIIHLIVKSLSV